MNEENKKETEVRSTPSEAGKDTHRGMVFKVAREHAKELSEWSKRSFESKKPFGQARPRF